MTRHITLETQIKEAIRVGANIILEKLLEKDPNLAHSVYDDGNNLIHIAVENNNYEAFQMLQKLNTELHLVNNAEKRAIDIAKDNNFQEVVQFYQDITNPLLKEAINEHDKKTAEITISKGADINYLDDTKTLLCKKVEELDIEGVDLLLSLGADLEKLNGLGFTTLSKLCLIEITPENKDTIMTIAKLILNAHPDIVNQRNANNRTAFDYAFITKFETEDRINDLVELIESRGGKASNILDIELASMEARNTPAVSILLTSRAESPTENTPNTSSSSSISSLASLS